MDISLICTTFAVGMNYRDILKRLAHEYDSGEAKAVLRLLLEEHFSLSWTDVVCGELDSLPSEKQQELEEMICRLESGEPVQYILGTADFCGRQFRVTPSVLIPRPETECLVNEASNSLSTLRHLLPIEGELPVGLRGSFSLLDIGTGSGIIATTLALEHPDCQVEAWDISSDALDVARHNADLLGAKNIDFRQVDVLKASIAAESYSVIVSNPPYICDKERAEMDRRVLDHEPSLALFVPDEDPLRFYRRITHLAAEGLESGGHLLFEINREYGKEVADLLKNNGFIDISVIKDQYDNDRIVKGRKP